MGWIDAINYQFYRAYGGYMLVSGYQTNRHPPNWTFKITELSFNITILIVLVISNKNKNEKNNSLIIADTNK